MATLKGLLSEKIDRFEKLLDRLPERKHPEERLYTEEKNGHFRYRRVYRDFATGGLKKEYLNRNQMDVATELAKDEYYDELRDAVDEVLVALKKLDEIYDDNFMQVIYEALPEGKKALVQPVGMTMQEWLEKPCEPLQIFPEHLRYETSMANRVRSKSETIISDRVNYAGIPFKNECKVELAPGEFFYPDLLFFDPSTQQEIYWEHFGMLDDPEYLERALHKLARYSKFGIILGKNLIISFETKKGGFSRTWIDSMMDEHLPHLKHYFARLNQDAENRRKKQRRIKRIK